MGIISLFTTRHSMASRLAHQAEFPAVEVNDNSREFLRLSFKACQPRDPLKHQEASHLMLELGTRNRSPSELIDSINVPFIYGVIVSF